MKELPKKFIIFDTEYTSWEGALRGLDRPNEEKEIVQIGAIKVEDLNETDSMLLYVKPSINPILSEYFLNLTGISQKEVYERGISYKDALTEFVNWSQDLPLICYGFDGEVMADNANLVNLPFPFPKDRFKNVIDHFEANGIDTKGYMSSTIPKALGLTPPPNGHDALNDARSILVGLHGLHD